MYRLIFFGKGRQVCTSNALLVPNMENDLFAGEIESLEQRLIQNSVKYLRRNWKSLTNFTKNPILDVWVGSEYTCV